MPKPTGCTAKGKLTTWLRHHPGTYTAKDLALQHDASRSVVASTLAELKANGWATKQAAGRNTSWTIRALYPARPEQPQ